MFVSVSEIRSHDSNAAYGRCCYSTKKKIATAPPTQDQPKQGNSTRLHCTALLSLPFRASRRPAKYQQKSRSKAHRHVAYDLLLHDVRTLVQRLTAGADKTETRSLCVRRSVSLWPTISLNGHSRPRREGNQYLRLCDCAAKTRRPQCNMASHLM